jgi:hypothetical protein
MWFHAATRERVTERVVELVLVLRAVFDCAPRIAHVRSARRSRLKRVFEIERCARCGGRLEVIASIEAPN